MENPDVNNFTKTLHHRKILQNAKNNPTENQKNINRNISQVGSRFFTFSLPWRANSPSALPVSYTTGYVATKGT